MYFHGEDRTPHWVSSGITFYYIFSNRFCHFKFCVHELVRLLESNTHVSSYRSLQLTGVNTHDLNSGLHS